MILPKIQTLNWLLFTSIFVCVCSYLAHLQGRIEEKKLLVNTGGFTFSAADSMDFLLILLQKKKKKCPPPSPVRERTGQHLRSTYIHNAKRKYSIRVSSLEANDSTALSDCQRCLLLRPAQKSLIYLFLFILLFILSHHGSFSGQC